MKDTEIICTPENFSRKGPKKSIIEQSNSLRRKSLIFNANAVNEKINDDDAERSELVASERPITSTPSNSSPRRRLNDTPSSISSPQKEHFQGCLKLYAENKITKDNAWNLQLIDFMTSMIRRHDKRMENLQVASAVVDASTRIYSLRVDGVYHDVLKMAGGLVKASNAKRGKKDDDDGDMVDDNVTDSQAPVGVKKKRKKTRGAIADINTLNGDADLNDSIDPFLERLAAQTGDVTSSNRAFNATLPVNPITNCLVISTDDPFLEILTEEMCEDLELLDHIMLKCSLLPEYKDTDDICEPFTGFSVTNWNPEDEKSDRVSNWVEENRLNLSQQAMAFDLNADVEPIAQEEEGNFNNFIGDDEPLAGIDSDDEGEVCAVAAQRLAPRPADAICNAPPITALDRRLEYSYCAAWAGPAHWKPRASKLSSDAGSTRGGDSVRGTTKSRNKGVIDFMTLTAAPPIAAPPAPPHKICISRKTLAYSHAWNEANFKRPIDRGLSESHLCQLFLKKSTLIQRTQSRPEAEPATEPDHVADYDYNNEHDQSYCPASQPINEDNGEDVWDEGGTITRTSTDAADEQFAMVEPPAKVAKVFIPYAMRAKKIDMKLLKTTSWKLLTNTSNDEASKPTVEITSFANLLSKLPNHLPTANRESLSLPLSLLSVLHLANERGLKLKKHEDHKDFSIVGIIEVD